jgi:hypothetical protein
MNLIDFITGHGCRWMRAAFGPRPSDFAVRTIISKSKGTMPNFSGSNKAQTNGLIAYLKTL